MKGFQSFLVLTLFVFLSAQSVQAQSSEYKTAIGARLGYPFSLSLKHFISEKGAVEVFAGYRGYSFYSWFNVGGTYQHHFPLEGVDGLRWYVGGGASAFFWRYDDNFIGDGNTSFGVLGVGGLDYKFADYPVNISVDWMPLFFLNGYGNGFGGGYGALSLRYTLK
jgi:hypothetical protein